MQMLCNRLYTFPEAQTRHLKAAAVKLNKIYKAVFGNKEHELYFISL